MVIRLQTRVDELEKRSAAKQTDTGAVAGGPSNAQASAIAAASALSAQNAEAANGKLNIFDSYLNWSATSKLTPAVNADYVVERLLSYSTPSHTDGATAYLKFQLAPKLFFATRAEYLSDRGGLFSGVTQALKENTVTSGYQATPGFLMMGEWRRDFSNRPYSALAFAADAATYVLTGISIVFFLITARSDFTVAFQETKPLGHAAIR